MCVCVGGGEAGVCERVELINVVLFTEVNNSSLGILCLLLLSMGIDAIMIITQLMPMIDIRNIINNANTNKEKKRKEIQ